MNYAGNEGRSLRLISNNRTDRIRQAKFWYDGDEEDTDDRAGEWWDEEEIENPDEVYCRELYSWETEGEFNWEMDKAQIKALFESGDLCQCAQEMCQKAFRSNAAIDIQGEPVSRELATSTEADSVYCHKDCASKAYFEMRWEGRKESRREALVQNEAAEEDEEEEEEEDEDGMLKCENMCGRTISPYKKIRSKYLSEFFDTELYYCSTGCCKRHEAEVRGQAHSLGY